MSTLKLSKFLGLVVVQYSQDVWLVAYKPVLKLVSVLPTDSVALPADFLYSQDVWLYSLIGGYKLCNTRLAVLSLMEKVTRIIQDSYKIW